MKKSPLIFLLLFFTMITGCGQSGPLYLPQQPTPAPIQNTSSTSTQDIGI